MGCRTAGPPPVSGSSGASGAPLASPAPPSPELAALAAEYWEKRLQADPIEATVIGDRRFDDRMPDLSPAGFTRESNRLEVLRERVSRVAPASLGGDDRITQALLIGEIDTDLTRAACRLDEWSVDPREGPQVNFLRLVELQTVKTVAEGKALVARWQKMGPTLDQMSANLRSALAAGKVATRAEVERVLRQLDELLAEDVGKWVLTGPARAAHSDWPAAERRSFQEEVTAAVEGKIRPAFQRYRDVIRGEVLPLARDEKQVGLANVPGGDVCYRRLIKVHTSLTPSPDEVHRFGLDEVARIRQEMQRLGREALGTDDFAEIQRRLREDRTLYFTTRDEIEAKASQVLARAAEAMPRFLGKLPRTPCVIKRIESYEEKDSPIAYYRPPAIGGTRPGAYYVNTYDPPSRPRYEAEALALHEAIPGHHVQIAIAQELTAIPEFRKHVGVTAFVEGWGLYSERLGEELGLYSAPLDRMGMLSFDAWRACRLVVDTGMHAKGWSRAQAVAFMRNNTAAAANNIENEVDRYIGWPGQALAYKIGQREILRLRALAERQLGKAFDLRRFHDLVLGSGAVSLTVLSAQVDRWIGTVTAAR
jgi:uncharacterized protein (DUF885 family)